MFVYGWNTGCLYRFYVLSQRTVQLVGILHLIMSLISLFLFTSLTDIYMCSAAVSLHTAYARFLLVVCTALSTLEVVILVRISTSSSVKSLHYKHVGNDKQS